MGADNLVVRSDLQAAAAALSDNSRARRRSSGFSGKHADQWLPAREGKPQDWLKDYDIGDARTQDFALSF